MDCQRARHAVFLINDEGLEPELSAPLREHLSLCSGCASRYQYLTKLFALVRQRCGRLEAPQQLRARILSSFPHRQPLVRQVHE
jgi:mycothiol system anti-sigma-R factor